MIVQPQPRFFANTTVRSCAMAALLCVSGAYAVESKMTTKQTTIAQSTQLHTLKLVGSFNTADHNGHAIIIVEGEERVLSVGESVGNDWRLAEIHNRYVLLTDASTVIRLDLPNGNAYPIKPPTLEQEANTQPVEIHTSETHADLEPGQIRLVFAMTKEPMLDTESDDVPLEGLDTNDPGMTQTFSIEPIAEVDISERDELLTSYSEALEPGQFRTFFDVPVTTGKSNQKGSQE